MASAFFRNFTPFAGRASVPLKTRALAALSAAAQLALLAGAFYLALAVRFDFSLVMPDGRRWATAYFLPLLPVVLGVKWLTGMALSLHRGAAGGQWRFTSLGDAVRLLAGVVISVALLIAFYNGCQILAVMFSLHFLAGGLSESVFILDGILGLMFVGGAWISARLIYEESRPVAAGGVTRLLVIGAGEAAAAVLREIARMPEQRYRVVGLLDDDRAKHGTRLQAARVLGPIAELPRICREQQIGEILIALPSATNKEMQRIISLCRTAQMQADSASPGAAGNGAALRFRTVPSLQDILCGNAPATQIRDVCVNDVLGRDAVDMDLAAVGSMLHGQVVLVSGAGGSIGSELCRTICRFEPSLLVLVDKAENAIFEIERELKKSWPAIRMVPAIGDISDAVRVEQILADHAPAIIFHAAAHKHVPLAESNPGEAIRNNLFGTRILADAAAAAGVKHFVMISTDKAVNPSSIMGATKRCAEIYIQGLARRSRTNFLTVRFGNVLGSNGSVVPIFKQQIAAGGPVTVTHPEMRRYFMTIPEASQLVLQAAALGQRGEIFVLDMGKPVRILDLARDLIILSGLRPDADIPIVFTGLRPGEKLYEELSIRGENMAPTRHAKIAVWKSTPAEPPQIQKMIDELEPLQHCTDRDRILLALKTFVPEMKPWEAETQPETRTASRETRNAPRS